MVVGRGPGCLGSGIISHRADRWSSDMADNSTEPRCVDCVLAACHGVYCARCGCLQLSCGAIWFSASHRRRTFCHGGLAPNDADTLEDAARPADSGRIDFAPWLVLYVPSATGRVTMELLTPNQVVEVNRQQSARFWLAHWHDPVRQGWDRCLRRCPHHRRSA